MALPLKYNIRNIVVRKGSTLATAFTIGLTVAVFLMVMALARGIDLTLSSSGEPMTMCGGTELTGMQTKPSEVETEMSTLARP